MNSLVRATEATYNWLDERLGIGMILRATALHQVPRSVNWWYVFGSATLTAFVFQVLTGIFLAFVYIPSPDHAYTSLYWITHKEILGNVIRGIHYWGASAMVLLIFIHMTAHYLTGSYKYPRELQWLSGSVLLLLTLVMAFTGQLLRWNQDAYWAIVVGAEQAARTPLIGEPLSQLLIAGQVVGGNTLTRFYAIHVFLVPGLMFMLIGMHLYLVIYKGISEWPVPGVPVDPKTYWANYERILHEDGEPFFPIAVSKDAIMALIGGAVVVFLALHFGAATLGTPADPTKAANPRPDWYLIWYFALLAIIPPASENYFIILFPLVGFLILFLLPLANKGERHYSRRPWAMGITIFAAFSVGVLVWYGYQAPWAPDFVGADNAGIAYVPAKAMVNLTPMQRKGAAILHTYACLACHEIDGVGGHRGPALTNVGDQLSDVQLTWRILHGGLNMPPFAQTMTPAQLDEVVSYLETRRSTPAQASSP